MSNTAADTPGFKIQGEFFPWIGFDNWLLPDCRLARRVTGYSETDLLRGNAPGFLINAAFAAVAFRRARGVTVDDTADFFDRLVRLDEIEPVGFPSQQEADAGPPGETPPGSGPSESGTPSSDAPQET